MKWTREKPTAPGIYWYSEAMDPPTVVEVETSVGGVLEVWRLHFDGPLPIASMRGLWMGPVAPPAPSLPSLNWQEIPRTDENWWLSERGNTRPGASTLDAGTLADPALLRDVQEVLDRGYSFEIVLTSDRYQVTSDSNFNWRCAGLAHAFIRWGGTLMVIRYAQNPAQALRAAIEALVSRGPMLTPLKDEETAP